MCGLNGLTFRDEALLAKMNACVAHRGPDFAGAFFDGKVSMGHALLAIREVSNLSKQPYAENPEWALLFNGQIYNTERLKKGLKEFDPKRARVDTHILYRCIEERGWEFIRDVQGMFAIALYNSRQGIVRLYRDSTGQKPVYFWHDEARGNLAWSSEIKALLEAGAPREIDAEAVMVSASLGYLPGDRTLLKRVKKVRPGEVVTFDLASRRLSREFRFPDTGGYYAGAGLAATMADLLEEHLQSRDRVAINLSGGLDSSILLHEIRGRGHDVDTYTTAFEVAEAGNYNDDAALAKRLAADYGTKHTEIRITRGQFFEALPDAYASVEEPDYNISLPAYWLTAKHEGIEGDGKRVVLKGDGGDEVFGGYPYYARQARMDRQIRLLRPWLFNKLKNRRAGTDYRFDDLGERWLFFKDFGKRFTTAFDLDAVKSQLGAAGEDYLKKYGIDGASVFQMMLRDRVFWMASESFTASDKIYMRHSMEVRAPLSYQPFRDHVDAMLRGSKYFDRERNKAALRDYAESRLPAYITKRAEKTGWRAPVEQWYDAPAKDLFVSIVGGRAGKGSLVDWKAVKAWFESSAGWPGKSSHLYLSLALIADRFGLDL